MRGKIGFVVNHGQRGIEQQRVQLVERMLDAGLQRHQYHLRAIRTQGRLIGGRRIGGHHQLGTHLSQGVGEIVGGFACAGQQNDTR